jgi:hypothetical protein
VFKPGTKVRVSGLYQEIDAKGNPIDRDQATCTKGEVFPPTNAKGNRWTLAEKTPHRELIELIDPPNSKQPIGHPDID